MSGLSGSLGNWLGHRFGWFLSWLVIARGGLRSPNSTPAEARFDSIQLESPRSGTHTCTLSCQLAHCNRRLTRINYSSLTCDIHTAAHTHIHICTYTYAYLYTHSVHTRVQCSGALKLEPYRQPWLELPTRLVNRYIFFLLATLSFHLSVSLCLPLSSSPPPPIHLSTVEIEPCPCPELVRASAAAQFSASFSNFLSEIFCYFIFLLFMFIVIYLAVKKRKLLHTFKQQDGKR